MKHPPHQRPQPRGRSSAKASPPQRSSAADLRPARRLLAAAARASRSSIWYINPDAGGQAEGRRELQHRRVHDHDPGAAPGRHPAADPAGPAARGQGHRHRPDEPRPAVHRRVRQRRLPRRRSPHDLAGHARGAVLRGRRRGGHLGRRARRGAVLVQHPGALVPQVVRPEGRPGHDPAGHLGPDHRRGRPRTAARSASRPTSTRATSSGSTPWSRAPAATSSPTPRRASTPRSTSTPRPARRPPRSSRSSPTRRPRRRPLGVQRGHRPARPSARTSGAFLVNWTYIWTQLRRRPQPERQQDLGLARYPRDRRGQESRPPYGGIDIGVSKYSEPHGRRDGGRRVHHQRREPGRQRRARPATCRPARRATSTPTLKKIYPPDLLDLFQDERRRRRAAPGDAVLERHLRRHPDHLAPAVGRQLDDARRSPRRSSTTS